MVQKIDLSNLSSEVIAKTLSFLMGEPEYLRLKHNEALKRIQRKYKTNIGPDEIYTTSWFERKTYGITRTIPFHIDRIRDIILNQKSKILEASNEGFEKFSIAMAVRIKYNDTNSISQENWINEEVNISSTNIDKDLNDIVKNRLSNIKFKESSILFNNNMKILNIKGFVIFMFKKIKQPEKQQTENKKKERNKVGKKSYISKRPNDGYLKDASDFN